MLGKTCRICRHRKAKFKLPQCTHAICKKCLFTIMDYNNSTIITCPFCRKKQQITLNRYIESLLNRYIETFKQMHPIQQALIIFAIIKLIYV